MNSAEWRTNILTEFKLCWKDHPEKGHNFQWATGGWLWNSLGKAHMEPRQINTQLLRDKFRYQRVKSIGGFYILFMWIAVMAEDDNNKHVYCVGYTGIILCMSPANDRRLYSIRPFLISWAHTQNDPWIYIPVRYKTKFGSQNLATNFGNHF